MKGSKEPFIPSLHQEVAMCANNPDKVPSRILGILNNNRKDAGEIANLLQVDQTVVNVALLALTKNGLVKRTFANSGGRYRYAYKRVAQK